MLIYWHLRALFQYSYEVRLYNCYPTVLLVYIESP